MLAVNGIVTVSSHELSPLKNYSAQSANATEQGNDGRGFGNGAGLDSQAVKEQAGLKVLHRDRRSVFNVEANELTVGLERDT